MIQLKSTHAYFYLIQFIILASLVSYIVHLHVKGTVRVVKVIECGEDPDEGNETGLEKVQRLTNVNKMLPTCQQIIPVENILKPSSIKRIKECVKNYKRDYKLGHSSFWDDPQAQFIRHKHHTYLNNNSLMIEVGGNIGFDAEEFITRYRPQTYVVLEPLKFLHSRLKITLQKYENVKFYNFGLGIKNQRLWIKATGNDGDATSVSAAGSGTCSMKIVNATSFFEKLGVGCFEVDLITINCEGCEFELLELLVSTSLIKSFRHIQFGTHTLIKTLNKPVERYCRLQELLAKTHRFTYKHKFQWESWQRLDI